MHWDVQAPETFEPSSLSRNHVHVWLVPQVQPAKWVLQSSPTLSESELERVGRLRSESDRATFTCTRICLRALLGSYLGVEPAGVALEYSSRGKPFVAGNSDSRGLQFSLSHSETIALLAFTRDRAVGVDVERIRPLPNLEELAAAVFCPSERETLSALPTQARLAAFYWGWTYKEAYLKGTGEGLEGNPRGVVTRLTRGGPPALLSVHGDPAEAAQWSLRPLQPLAGYVGAVAVQGHGLRLACMRWSWSSVG